MNQEFDMFAHEYREIHTENVMDISGVSSDYFTEYKVRELLQILPQNTNLKFLDLGCGDGNTAKYMRQCFSSVEYYGIDVSTKSISVAVHRQLNDCHFEVYDGDTIPYEDNTFDVVFMACVMHHIPVKCRQQILFEARRVLKQNGLLIIFEHNPYNPVTRKLVSDCPFDKNAVLLSVKCLKKWLKNVGFNKKKNIRYTIFFPRKGLFKKLLFLERSLYWCFLGGQYYCVVRK